MWHHAMKVLLVFICLSVVTANEELCDGQGYFYSKEVDRCYKKHEESVWFEAMKQCRSEGASLLVLETIKKANYIKSLGVLNIRGYGFVGVHDAFQDGVFVTIHGDLLDTLEFRTFGDGQPSKMYYGAPEHYMEIREDFTFNDIRGDWKGKFYCEKAAKKQDDRYRSITLQVPKDGFTSPIIIMP